MGSPEFSVPILQMLAENYQITGVITQPDQPVGRGRKMEAPAVKQAGQKLGLPVFQPERIKGEEFLNILKKLEAEAIVVAAYGKILPKKILELPKFGCINVHASLLPRWRGAAPIQYAILKGDKHTGVTIMLMDEGLDTGAILTQEAVEINERDTADILSQRLAIVGAELLQRTLEKHFAGKTKPEKQVESSATYTKMIKKEDGRMDFHLSAEELERQVRAFNPWPSSYFLFHDTLLKVRRAQVGETKDKQPSERGIIGGIPCIGTSTSDLYLLEIQPSGKRSMSGREFLNGARNWIE